VGIAEHDKTEAAIQDFQDMIHPSMDV